VARQAGAVVTSDIEQVSPTVEELVSSVTYPIFDQHLTGQLTGESDPERALRKLRRLNAGLLCMTLGEAGAVALDGDRVYVVPACLVQVVDSTGAGDVFRAGFIYGLLQHWSVPHMLRFANVAAAVSCTRLGAIPSVPALAEVQDLLSSAR
jgi:sugar/nucleoside kinase (ribokinase family)